MLLISASAGPSKLHGMGLIAREQIPKGTRIWQFVSGFDVLITEEEFSKLSLPARQQVLHYAYFDVHRNKFVLSSDDDRFTNHSDLPNTKDFGDYVEAAVDIAPGEEITANYVELGPTTFMGKHANK
jgi:uncharacterized protein